MKEILALTSQDTYLRLYGFQENSGEKTSLSNNTLFVDVDGEVYFSDMVSTFLWKTLKHDLYLWNIKNFSIQDFLWKDMKQYEKTISHMQEKNYKDMQGQKQLHQLMDYFSQYLNAQNG